MLKTTDRAAVTVLLQQDHDIDVVIPRGGLSLINTLSEESRIPLLKHLQGICHTYIHSDANLDMARDVLINAKCRRPGICGATETVLIDQTIAADAAPMLIDALIAHHCEVRGDEQIQSLHQHVSPATEEDWDTEYLDLIVSMKVVAGIDEAIAHINRHGSQHTDAIITDNARAAAQFCNTVDSAITMHNTSTQFADGGEFGMGAEIGIATGKLHARGPVGVEQLTTFKYNVLGKGQVRPI
ncbi:MAG: glutamate-5-semialdehyde dehydrogenase, partial [Coxiellaceae bacterium]|nr:glutamate-5-semialdehyde dehydrogenase [Coxiellaceae bacterium]